MEKDQIKYYQRIVVFLDVLGFQNSLNDFENEAISMHAGNKPPEFLISEKANEFVDVFKEVIGLMDSYDCKYYLFSDNICITVDPFNNKSLAVDILFTVSTLFKKFSEMGYFLRGGIDFGWMLDENDIALGVPLAEAYRLESKKAIYPRIVLSQKYIDFVNNIDLPESDNFNFDNFVLSSCEVNYINTFYNIIRNDDKVSFLESYKMMIEEKLKVTKKVEHDNSKFVWLKNEFNQFVDTYIKDIGYFEQDYEFETEVLDKIAKIKIK